MQLQLRPSSLEPTARDLMLIRSPDPRDRAAREAVYEHLLEAWEEAIQGMATRYAPMPADRLDFAQTARLALFRAATRFRDLPGNRFEHYARRSIRHALLDELRRYQAHRRQALRCRRPEAIVENGLARLVREETCARVRQTLSRWRPRLQELARHLFYRDLTQAEVARHLGVTPARVNQLLQAIRLAGQRDLQPLADLAS